MNDIVSRGSAPHAARWRATIDEDGHYSFAIAL
jgi:hypothetical protein